MDAAGCTLFDAVKDADNVLTEKFNEPPAFIARVECHIGG